MSDSGYITGMALPTARVVDTGSVRPYAGSVGPLKAYTPELGAVLRRSIPEIAEIEQVDKKTYVDSKTGTAYRLITSLVDPSNPSEARIAAFCVRDNWVCYLRPVDAVEEVKTVGYGEISGWRA